jgi:hypothetical protein
LPEVIRLEVEHHLRAEINKIKERIYDDHQRLLGMVGKLNELILPDDARINDVVANFISSLEFDLVETSLTLEAARSSFLRTIDKITASHNDQQFKDGVIWSDCLTLAQTDDVTLVTNDKAFYQDGDIKNGLSLRLLSETTGLPHHIKVVGSLGALMVDIRARVDVSDELLVSAITGILDRLGFTRAGDPVVTKTFYATEKRSILFVEFRLDFPCEDASQAGRVDAVLTIAGDGQYQTRRSGSPAASPERGHDRERRNSNSPDGNCNQLHSPPAIHDLDHFRGRGKKNAVARNVIMSGIVSKRPARPCRTPRPQR